MKKTLAFLLTILLAFGALTGCAQDEPAADAEKSIALVMGNRDEWLSLLADEVVKAAESAGYEIEVYDAEGDATREVEYVELAAKSGAGAIIANLSDSSLTGSVIEAANGKNLIFVNREPDDFSRLSENVIFVGSDENEAGRMQGEALAAYFQSLGQSEVRYIMLEGQPELRHSSKRTASALDALTGSGVNAVPACEPIVANYDRASATEQLGDLLSAEAVEFDCIIANNDAMAFGAIAAMEVNGLDPASVPIVGIDAVEEAREDIREGKMLMSVYQSVDGQAAQAVEAAGRLIAGESLDALCNADTAHTILVPFEPVSAENL